MSDFSAVVASSHLWRSTLALQPHDRFMRERERLRSSFMSFRGRAAQLAEEVRRDLPDLTFHDVTHLDALWEVGSLVVGEEYTLTPTEGYVLGGAILLHDLAMSVAAWPGGHEALKSDLRYRDLIFRAYQERLGRNPSDDELLNPEAHIRRRALFELLRQVHAENAERLAFLSYHSGTDTPLFLI